MATSGAKSSGEETKRAAEAEVEVEAEAEAEAEVEEEAGRCDRRCRCNWVCTGPPGPTTASISLCRSSLASSDICVVVCWKETTGERGER